MLCEVKQRNWENGNVQKQALCNYYFNMCSSKHDFHREWSTSIEPS